MKRDKEICSKFARILADIPEEDLTGAERSMCLILKRSGHLIEEKSEDGYVYKTTEKCDDTQ